MKSYKEKCGYTRSMYIPNKTGDYIVKNNAGSYFLSFWNGKKWSWDADEIIAWIEIPKTDIDTPF